MEYTSAQRAFLRSSAQTLSPVVMVGKEGVTAAVAKALCDAADCHELVKVRFQAHKDEVKELSFQLEKASGVDLIVTTGFTAIFFRQAKEADRRRYDIRRLSVID